MTAYSVNYTLKCRLTYNKLPLIHFSCSILCVRGTTCLSVDCKH